MFSDFLTKDAGLYSLLVRDHKTSQTTGLYKCNLPRKLGDLMDYWLGNARKKTMEKMPFTHDIQGSVFKDGMEEIAQIKKMGKVHTFPLFGG